MKIPKYCKYCIGEEWPGDEYLIWVIRMRNPFLLAQVEPMGLVGLRLHCWPPPVEKEIKAGKLARIIAEMACIFGEEVEELSGLPAEWSYVFAENIAVPEFMVVDGVRAAWTGILQPARKILWEMREDGLVWVKDFGGEPKFPTDTRAAAGYWQEFCRQEDEADKGQPTPPPTAPTA